VGRNNSEEIEILNKDALNYDFGSLLAIDMSWSRYNCYNECNAKYKFKYIEGYKEETTTPLALGKAIHDTLEAVVKYKTTDDMEAIGFYLMSIEKFKQDIVLSTNEIEEGKEQVINVLSKMDKLTSGELQKVKGVETGFKYVISRGIFLGYIDLIILDKDENGPFINVIDYKTGKHKYKTKTHDQMKLYTLAVKEMYPGFRVKASLYWTRFGDIDTYEFSDDELLLFKNVVIYNLNKLIEDTTFEPNADMFKCVYCQFSNKEICKKGYSNRIIMDKAKRNREAKKNGL
jgi:CRISPR/Cas system-associated exonuclease Cas4 (RecB family)